MESLLIDLKTQLTCSICLDTYTEPKTISCLHTFCCECLERHARVSQRQRKYRCPECQAEIDLPEGNRFDRLPNSFFHKSLLSLLAVRKSGEEGNITCYQCSTTSRRMFYCFDCGRFMCPNCFNAHEVLKRSFQGHKVTPIEDFKAEDYEALLKQQPFCTQQFHGREKARFFCSQCQVCICPICIVTDHQNHNAVLLDKAAHEEKQNITSGVEMIEKKETELRGVIKQFEETISELETNVATAKREVSQAAKQMITDIRQREREVIVSLETTRVSRLERIYVVKQEVESLVKQIGQAAKFAANLVYRGSSSDIMRNKDTLKQKFQELRGVEAQSHHQTAFVTFFPNSRQDLTLGVIKIIPTVANQSKLEGLDKIFQAGVEAELTLCPKTAGGEMIKQKDQVEFLIEPAEDVTNVTIQEKEDGNLRLRFTPKVPGAYSIEVKINGETLSNFPFPLQVEERELVVVGKLDLKLNQGQEFKEPNGIAVNRQGDIAVVDHLGHCVYVFSKEGDCLRQIGKEGKDSGQFKKPTGVSFLNDNEILIVDQLNNRIQQIDIRTGYVLKIFGQKGEEKGHFWCPLSICLNDEERIVVTDCKNQRVQVMSKEGETIFTIGDRGPERLSKPHGCIAYKSIFLVTERDTQSIQAFDSSGTLLYKFGENGNQNGQFNTLSGMCLDSSNNLLVCDLNNNRVQQFSLDGRFTGKTVVPLQGPIRIVTAPDGRILVSCMTARKIYILK
ncbi:protein lin-41-like [Stylophora pistillata]|uniref:protein lin-41-like n=1 Tax=Stylophora pistillata TaxID=50429 RepID=UPI000C04B8E7|nr:protein lin-41-like [Stylophora pistillata]